MNSTTHNARRKSSFREISQNTYPMGDLEVTVVLYASKLARHEACPCAVEMKTRNSACSLEGLSFHDGKRVMGMLVKNCVSPSHLRDVVEDMRRDDLYGGYTEWEL